MTLNRKQLPTFGRIQKRVDIDRLRQYVIENGYTEYSKFDDINYSTASGQKAFLVANGYCKENFFKEDDAPFLEGEKYRQLYLTEIDESKLVNTEERLSDTHKNIFTRTKRLDPTSPMYVAEADELNYTKRNERVTGIFAELLDSFDAMVTRVRLAALAPGFGIKPHVDYDPSYITRYHIPIFTNEKVVFGMKVRGEIETFSMPADGSIYFFNTGLVHWVDNNSDEYRLHLIVDTHGQDDLILA